MKESDRDDMRNAVQPPAHLTQRVQAVFTLVTVSTFFDDVKEGGRLFDVGVKIYHLTLQLFFLTTSKNGLDHFF